VTVVEFACSIPTDIERHRSECSRAPASWQCKRRGGDDRGTPVEQSRSIGDTPGYRRWRTMSLCQVTDDVLVAAGQYSEDTGGIWKMKMDDIGAVFRMCHNMPGQIGAPAMVAGT